MPYQEIDTEGNPVFNDEGKPNVIENAGSWEVIKSSIPEELQSEKIWENIPDTSTLLKNYAHAQKLVGSSVRIPGEDASSEEWSKFYAKLGRPEDVSGYELALPEVDGGWNENLVHGLKEVAHKEGITPKQLQALFNFYGPYANDAVAEFNANRHNETMEAEKALREKWGGAYEQKVETSRAALRYFASDNLVEKLEKTGIGNDPELVAAFAKVGELLQEDGYIAGHFEGITTKETAQEEINKINSDQKHAYWNPNDPGHEAAVKKMRSLFQIVHG